MLGGKEIVADKMSKKILLQKKSYYLFREMGQTWKIDVKGKN